MNRDEIMRELADIEHALTERVEVWRIIVKPDGTVSGRLYLGSSQRPGEPQDKHQAGDSDRGSLARNHEP